MSPRSLDRQGRCVESGYWVQPTLNHVIIEMMEPMSFKRANSKMSSGACLHRELPSRRGWIIKYIILRSKFQKLQMAATIKMILGRKLILRAMWRRAARGCRAGTHGPSIPGSGCRHCMVRFESFF